MCFIKYYDTKTYGEVQLQLHVFSASAIDADEWSTSLLQRFTILEGYEVGLHICKDECFINHTL